MKIPYRKLKELIAQSWAVSWPMALIMLFEFLMGLTDVFIAGKISKEIQAAYGLAFQLYLAGLIPVIAFTAGSVSVISRLFTASGCENTSKADINCQERSFGSAVSTSIFTVVMMGLVVSALGFYFSSFVVTILKVPSEIKAYSSDFAKIYSLGLFFEYFLVNSNGILRSCGKVQISMRNYACITVLNVVLNFILVFKTLLGFRGIAIATVISVAVGAVLNAHAVKKFASEKKLDTRHLKDMVNIGWPIGVLQVLWNLASLVIFSILAKLPKHSIEVIAAFTNGLKVESAIFLPVFAFNMANAVVVGNFLGKGKKLEAYHAGFVTAGLGMAITTVMSLVVILCAQNIMHILSNNQVVIENGIRYLYISLWFEPIMAWGVILGGGLAGAGFTKRVLFAVALSVWVVRVPLCYILGIVSGMGPVGIWWSMNISIIIQCVLLSYGYFRKMKPLGAQSV